MGTAFAIIYSGVFDLEELSTRLILEESKNRPKLCTCQW